MKQRAERLLARLPEASLRVLVLGSALAIGAVHPVSGLAVAVVAAAFAVPAVIASERQVRLPLLVWAIVLAGGWSLVQTLPSGGLAASLSPAVGQLWALAPGEGARLSANLEATRLAALRFFLVAIVLVGSVVWFRRADRARALIDLLIVSAAVVAVIGFVQSWLRTDAILFLYEPTMGPVREGLRGPFVNPDHFGAYCAVGSLLATSRGALIQVSRRRFLDYGLGALLLVATLLSYSLSAVFGLLIGLIWLLLAWSRRDRKLGDLLGVAVGLLVTAGFVSLLALTAGMVPGPMQAVEGQVDSIPVMVGVWGETWGLAAGAPLVGVGSGSLADLLGARLDAPAVSVWFARNQGLQWLVDLGLVVGLALIVSTLLVLRRVVTRWPMDHLATMLPLSVALVGLGAIALVDFALAIPALGIVGALLLGAVFAQARRLGGRGDGLLWGGLPRLSRALLVAIVLLVSAAAIASGAWALATGARSSQALERLGELADGLLPADAEPVAVERAAAERLAFRPGQARVYTVAGRALLRLGATERARRWLEAAVALRPKDWTAHELLALVELRTGGLEASVEAFERAIAAEPGRLREILSFVIGETDDPELWIGLTAEPARQRLLVRELLAADRGVDALRYASARLTGEPDSAAGYEAGAGAAFDLGFDDLAAYYARNLSRVDPDSVRAEVIQARVELRRGDIDSAAERIEAVLAESPEDYEAWFARGEILVRRAESGENNEAGGGRALSQMVDQMREVRAHLRAEALADPDRSIGFHRLSARFYLAIGNYRAAASAAAHGIDLGAEHAELHAVRGLSLFELSDVAGATSALRRAIELGSTDPRVVERWSQLAEGPSTDGEGAGAPQ